MSLSDLGKKLFGSLSEKKFDIDKEIVQKQEQLRKLAARVAVKQCNGWDDLRAELTRAADESSRLILQLSINPQENHNIIIAEGAKRERDMEWIREIDNSEAEHARVLSEIETLNMARAAFAAKKERSWGLMPTR